MARSRSDSRQLLAEYYFANPPPGAFLKRHLFGPNRRLLLQLQKATTGSGDTPGRAVPAYDVRCGGSFMRRLAGCFRNASAKDIVIVASSSDEPGEKGSTAFLARITRISVKDAGGGGVERLLVRFFDGATWNCEMLPASGGFQFTPLSGGDLDVQALWEPEAAEEAKRQGFLFSVSATGSPTTPRSATPRSATPRSATPKSPGGRRRGPDVLARMDAERVQVFGVRAAPKGSFLSKMDEKNLERMVLVSGICVRTLQGTI